MEELDPEEQFLQFARNGDLAGIQGLLMSKIKEETQININCKGTRLTCGDGSSHVLKVSYCAWTHMINHQNRSRREQHS